VNSPKPHFDPAKVYDMRFGGTHLPLANRRDVTESIAYFTQHRNWKSHRTMHIGEKPANVYGLSWETTNDLDGVYFVYTDDRLVHAPRGYDRVRVETKYYIFDSEVFTEEQLADHLKAYDFEISDFFGENRK